MRKLLVLLTSVLFVSACADMDNMFGDQHDNDGYYGGNGYYGNNGYYGGGPGYGNYGGGGYYPYGNYNYPRDRIYVITPYNPCRGYAYEGYCYRDKDDYRNAVIWDQNHQNDVNWNKRRKDWCNSHDCGHGARHPYGTTDAHGKPLEQPVDRDRSEKLYPSYPNRPAARPVPYEQPRHERGEDESRDRHTSERPRYVPPVPAASPARDEDASDVQHSRPQRENPRRPEAYQPRSYQPPVYQPQPYMQPDSSPQHRNRSSSVESSQPPSSGGGSDQSGRSQRKHGGRAVDLGASPE